MGIFSDILEDNRERLGSLEGIGVYPGASSYWVPPRLAPRLPCPSCQLVFAAEAALQAHLFEVHAGESFYVRVNGRVAQDAVYLDDVPSTLSVVALGAAIGVMASSATLGDALAEVEPGRPLDVISLLGIDQETRGLIRLVGRSGRQTRTFDLYVRDLPVIDYDRLDAIVAEAQDPLVDGRAADVGHIIESADRCGPDSLERRYLRGFAEYLMGCNLELESNWTDAGGRFLDAYGLLRVFSVPQAQTVRGILDYRMMAADRLIDRGATSRFFEAGHFFRSPELEPASSAPAGRSSSGVWMDDLHEALLRAIHWYYVRDYEACASELATVANWRSRDAGSVRKFLILQARLLSRTGDVDAARRAYGELMVDPVFAQEAEDYVR